MGSFSNLKWQVGQMLTSEVHLLEVQLPLLILFGELCTSDDGEVQCGSFLPPSDLWLRQDLELVDKSAILVLFLPSVLSPCLFHTIFQWDIQKFVYHNSTSSISHTEPASHSSLNKKKFGLNCIFITKKSLISHYIHCARKKGREE